MVGKPFFGASSVEIYTLDSEALVLLQDMMINMRLMFPS